jgi:hypothetical protein
MYNSKYYPKSITISPNGLLLAKEIVAINMWLSPDNRLIATGESGKGNINPNIKIWNISTGGINRNINFIWYI